MAARALSAPIALDAMGGDKAPDEVIAGALRAVKELDVPVVLVGDPGRLEGAELPVIAAHEVIDMHDDPGKSVRTKKDSSLIRAAEAVRDGRASAMVSAGNTGATMASALLRMGRLRGVGRPAIATPIPVPRSTPTILLDAGANAECNSGWLVQFAQMGSAFCRDRFDIEQPRVGLLSIGEEESKGNALVKETHARLASGEAGPEVNFIGNMEGRDVMSDRVDVVVTDGFTGNVVLKTLEGGVNTIVDEVMAAFRSSDETKKAADVMLPALAPLAETMDPDTYGGALLLGTKGVCVISHGSSGERAILEAIRVAANAVTQDWVADIARSIQS